MSVDTSNIQACTHCGCSDYEFNPLLVQVLDAYFQQGWVINCTACGKTVIGDTIEEMVNLWNEEEKEEE